MGQPAASTAWFVIATSLVACQQVSDADAGAIEAPDAVVPDCSLRDGDYEVEYRRRAGDCDDNEDALRLIEQQLQFMTDVVRIRAGRVRLDQQCLSQSIELDATCVLDVRRTCAFQPPLSGSYTVTGQLSIEEDTLEGELTFSVTTPVLRCSDTYEAEGERSRN